MRLDWDGRRVARRRRALDAPVRGRARAAGRTPADGRGDGAAAVQHLRRRAGRRRRQRARRRAGARGSTADAARATRGVVAGGGAGILLAPADRLAAGDGRRADRRRRWPRRAPRSRRRARGRTARRAAAIATAMRELGARAVAHRGAGDLRHAARRVARAGATSTRSTRGSRAARRRAGAAARRDCWPTTPALGRSDVALMPPPRRDALLRAIVPALRPRSGVRARADVGRRAGRDRRARAHARASAGRGARARATATRSRRACVARLAELALLLRRARRIARAAATRRLGRRRSPLGAGEGLAAVQTARGLLLHRVRVARRPRRRLPDRRADRVELPSRRARSRAASPASTRRRRADAAARSARLAVQALDPCVACRVEVGHA